MAKSVFGIPQTKGSFQLKGVVSGTGREQFYKDGVARNGKDYRMINVGVEIERGVMVFLNLFGMVQKEVTFSKFEDGKADNIKVDWANRNKFNREGYRMFGVTLGLEKGEDGKNKVLRMTQFDACDYIAKNLKDGDSIFVRGQIEFNHFQTENGVVRTQKLVPQQISLCQEVDFEADGFESVANFTQEIIFQGVEKLGDNEFNVDAMFVNYNSIEQDVLLIQNGKLAKQMKDGLKPYHKIQVHGRITAIQNSEVVQEEESADTWGEENEMEKGFTPYRRVFLITGAKPDTIIDDLYTEKNIGEAIASMNKEEKAESEFGSDDDWGDADLTEDDESW